MTPDKIKTLEDVKVWVAVHEERSISFWESQAKINATFAKEIKTMATEVMAIKSRILWVAGFCSGVCASLGAFLGSLFGG